MSASAPPTAGAPALPGSIAAVVGFLVFTEFASGFMQGYYNPLLTRIVEHHGADAAAANWFNSVFALAGAVLVPLLSKLGDRYGHRLVLRWAVVVVVASALLVAFAPSYDLLLVGRALMGPLAVWLPLEIAIIHSRLSGHTAQRAIVLVVAVLTGGSVVGSLAAGAVSAVLPELWMSLLAPVVILAVALYAVFARIPETTQLRAAPIGYAGFAGLAVILGTLIYGLAQVPAGGLASPATLIPLAIAVVVAAVWIPWQRRSKTPAIDFSLVGSRRLGPVFVASLLFGMLVLGNVVPFVTFFSADPATTGYGFGFDVGALSLLTAGFSSMLVVGGLVSTPLTRRLGLRLPLAAASVVCGAAFAATIALHGSFAGMVSAMVVLWLAAGFVLGLAPAIVAELAPAGQTGIAAGLYNTLRSVGSALAGAVFALALAAFAGANGIGVGGYVLVWVISAVGFVVAGALVWAARDREGRDDRPGLSSTTSTPTVTTTSTSTSQENPA